ncbi:MAG: hypothetical protein FWH35_02285 [Treponema sp.]|nr:hypothetical protein [Treponema sp.]
MKVQGCDCSIVIKTAHREFDVPYSEETIREAYSLLQEEAAIEGDGVCRAIQKKSGVTGCVVTPLTIRTVEHLLYLAMGFAGNMEFVSETRNLYRYCIEMLPMEDTDCFDLIQDRIGNREQGIGNRERLLFEGCCVKGFELRIDKEQAIKLKLEISSNIPPVIYPYTDTAQSQTSEMSGTAIGRELFNGDNVKYRINGKEYSNIYGLTLSVKKENGTRTEIWIKRVLQNGTDIPEIIDELIITTQLLRDKYENRHFGTFRITVKQLVLISDETNINSSDTVIGPLRYYVAGIVKAEVFTSSEDSIT